MYSEKKGNFEHREQPKRLYIAQVTEGFSVFLIREKIRQREHHLKKLKSLLGKISVTLKQQISALQKFQQILFKTQLTPKQPFKLHTRQKEGQKPQ